MGRHRNVQRVDRENFHGWVVSVKRRGRVGHSDHFSDRRHGGRERALQAAIERRDELEASLPPATHLRRTDSRSKTGIVGVALVRRRRGGRIFRYWTANWVELDGRRQQCTFGEAKYGAVRARKLAERARLKAVERILGQHGTRPWWQRRGRRG